MRTIRGKLAIGAHLHATNKLVCGRTVWILTVVQSRASAAKSLHRIRNDPTLSGRLLKRLLTTLELRWFRLDSHRSSDNMRAIVGSLVGLVGFSSVALALSPGVAPSTFPTEPEEGRTQRRLPSNSKTSARALKGSKSGKGVFAAGLGNEGKRG